VYRKKDELVFTTGESNVNEEVLTDASGRKRFISSKKVLLRGPAGERYILGMIFDLTDRKQMEEELSSAKEKAEKADSAKTKFLASMSHELRTPLNGIVGMCRLLIESKLDKNQLELLKLLDMSAGNLARIINGLLDLSQIEVGGFSIKPEQFNLRELLLSTLSMVKPMVREKNLALESSFSLDNDSLFADRLRISQILLNLIMNAVKYTDEGSVRLEVDKNIERKGILRILVTDTGIGIPADRLDSIFDSFSQIDTLESSGRGGLGLGLSITKQLVDLMEGEMNVESVPGKGSAFAVTFPVRLGTDGPISSKNITEENGEEISRELLHGKKVLVAEDEAINKLYMARFLGKLGMIVDSAENGAEVLRKHADEQYDIILMDVSMPEIDGLEATRRIRAENNSKNGIPIIALTAYAYAEDVEKCMKAGMDEFISKPINEKRLINHMVGLLSENSASPRPGK
jgi:signal transduction histidine kinase/CheY-like chemotaxis protein